MSPTGLPPRSPAKSSAPGRLNYDISCTRHFYKLPPIAYTERHGVRINSEIAGKPWSEMVAAGVIARSDPILRSLAGEDVEVFTLKLRARISTSRPYRESAGASLALRDIASPVANIVVWRDLYVRGKCRDVILPITVPRRLDAVLESARSLRETEDDENRNIGIACWPLFRTRETNRRCST